EGLVLPRVDREFPRDRITGARRARPGSARSEVMTAPRGTIGDVVDRFRESYRPLVAARDEKRHFHAVYMRNTVAVKEDLERGGFLDPAWVEEWDGVFANLYLDSLDRWNLGQMPSEPWRISVGVGQD